MHNAHPAARAPTPDDPARATAGAREMFVDVAHPTAGATRLTGAHIKLTATPARIRTPAPLLGQHNDEVFGGLLGLATENIAQLRHQGVL